MSNAKFKVGDRIYYKHLKGDAALVTKGTIIQVDYKSVSFYYTIKWDDASRIYKNYRWHKDAIEANYSLVENEAEQTLSRLMYC